MKTTDTSEKGFQKFIVKELVEKQGYIETNSNEFDREWHGNILSDRKRKIEESSTEFVSIRDLRAGRL